MKCELKVIKQQDVLGKNFTIYGNFENPLFLAKDVARWIDHSNVTEMLRFVDDDEKLISTILRAGQSRDANFLTEQGLYEVLMLSRKPIAKDFKKEVKKILRSIRINGGYIAGQESMDAEVVLANAIIVANNIISRQKQQIEENAQKVAFYNTVAQSDDCVDMGEAAKLLKLKNIGRNNLFSLLREKGILNGKNEPMQKYIDRGYFKVVETSYAFPNGKVKIALKTLVTQKGLMYLNSYFFDDVAV
ncbi:MAG: phage antirepressor [Treponemataceae bacterium]